MLVKVNIQSLNSQWPSTIKVYFPSHKVRYGPGILLISSSHDIWNLWPLRPPEQKKKNAGDTLVLIVYSHFCSLAWARTGHISTTLLQLRLGNADKHINIW